MNGCFGRVHGQLVALLLILVTLIACWLLARRAAKTDPLTAVRNELSGCDRSDYQG